MTLSPEQYNQLQVYRATIRHVANGGSTSNPDIWHQMNQIKFDITGWWSRSDCDACKAELFREFEIAMVNYEAQ